MRRERRIWSDNKKRSIGQQTAVPSVSVAQVARRYAKNANMIFRWLRNPHFAPKPVETEEAEPMVAAMVLVEPEPAPATYRCNLASTSRINRDREIRRVPNRLAKSPLDFLGTHSVLSRDHIEHVALCRVGLFSVGCRDVSDRSKQALVIEPVDPVECRHSQILHAGAAATPCEPRRPCNSHPRPV
jgi:transposase-like protein